MRALLKRLGRHPPPVQPPALPTETPVEPPVVPRGQKILIVDDDPVTLKTTGAKLEAKGFGVVTASEGADAIHAARNGKPDLILLDLCFPADVVLSWDGFLIMDWLRRMEETRHIPVFVITSGEPSKYQQRCLKAGAAGFFQKPIPHDQLLASIGQALEGAKALARDTAEFQI